MRFLIILVFLSLILASSASATIVSNMEVYELGDDGFVIGWQTDEPSTSQVLFGTSGRLGGSTSEDPSLKMDHLVQVDGLDPETVYFFRATGSHTETYFSSIGVTRTTPSQNSPPSFQGSVTHYYIEQSSREARGVQDGETIDLSTLPNNARLAVETQGEVESVLLYKNNQYLNTERHPPYTFFATDVFEEGTYSFSATPYSGDCEIDKPICDLTSGESSSIELTFVNSQDSSDDDIPTSTDEGQLIWYNSFDQSVETTEKGDLSKSLWRMNDDSNPRLAGDARLGANAIRLGDYNTGFSRNEIKAIRLMDFSEHWIGFSIKVVDPAPAARPYTQHRPSRASGGVGDGVINPLTLRQGSKAGTMYFATATIEENVNTIYQTGASTGTESHYFDYEVGEWIDVVIHRLWDDEDGFLRVWVDGDLIVDETGTTVYRYAHVDGEPYEGYIINKIGPYWSPNNDPQGDVYYDEYKVWKGKGKYEYVSPGGLSPNDQIPNQPTCNDGIRNGNEQGVDCGGSCTNSCSSNTPPTGAYFASSGERYIFVEENTRNPSAELIGIDADNGETFTYELLNTATHNDRAFYSLNGNTLTLNLNPDFENPQDSNANNKYGLDVRLTDSSGNSFVQNVYFEITDVSESTDVDENDDSDSYDDVPSGTPNGRIVFDNGFEGGTADWTDGKPWKGHHANAKITSDAREGSNAIRFLPNPTKERSELQPAKDGVYDFLHWEQEYWQGFSVKLIEPPIGNRMIQQHHAIPHDEKWSGDPNGCKAGVNGFTLEDDGNNFIFQTSTDQSLTHKKSTKTCASCDQEETKFSRELNRWYDVVMRFKYTPNTDGFFEVWVDGKKVVNKQNLATVYKYDPCGNLKHPEEYLKIGLYYGDGRQSGEVMYDAIRIWEGTNGYDMVKPRGSPTPDDVDDSTIDDGSSKPTSFGVDGFYLNSGTGGEKIRDLRDGETIDLADLPSNAYVAANTYGDPESVIFYLNGGWHNTENNYPWTFFDGFNNLPGGEYTIGARSYDQDGTFENGNNNGEEGESDSIRITVVDTRGSSDS